MIIPFDEMPVNQAIDLLTHAIAPRPIGLISTIDRDGKPNLAPFSFFNVVSGKPPILIFSPLRRIRNNTAKHTIHNLYEVPEAVIHVVTYDRIRQMNLAACEYPDGVDEFIKAGFTKEKAVKVKPWMIKECTIKFECKIIEIKPLGDEGGAGTLCIAEIRTMHIDDQLLDPNKKMDQTKLKHVARLGADWYIQVSKANLFALPKPTTCLGIGFDELPTHIRNSQYLTPNHLGQLAAVEAIPVYDENFSSIPVNECLLKPAEEREHELEVIAGRMLDLELTAEAWQVLLRSKRASK